MARRGLVVDDELAVCELIGKVLISAGMEAQILTRSAEAPGVLEEQKFDVVFLDLHMASPDGIELARQMRSSQFNQLTPIILISDDQRPSALSIAFAAGATFFLYKPIDKDRLWKLVRATQGTRERDPRQTRRVPIHSRVRLKFGVEEFDGETINISLSGMLVNAPRTAPVGSALRFSLHLSPLMKPIVGAGSVVRHADGNQMGIQLQQLSVAESNRLQEFLLPLIPVE